MPLPKKGTEGPVSYQVVMLDGYVNVFVNAPSPEKAAERAVLQLHLSSSTEPGCDHVDVSVRVIDNKLSARCKGYRVNLLHGPNMEVYEKETRVTVSASAVPLNDYLESKLNPVLEVWQDGPESA